ncbi:MAG: SurA N-terminal domain-containing protein, partial [Burkholderiales bacterium]|nr:SurA N-terminal domain-containing protein [Burkholderiales bacterium]
MFDFIRSHSRLMLGLVVLLIIPSFVFFGIQGYTSFTDAANAAVAQVDGRKITRAEWDAAHQRAIDRLRQQMPGVDVNLLDTPQMKRQTLDAIVRERVLLAEANARHLFPSDQRLQRLFVADPQYEPLRNPDGSVKRELLAAQGLSSELFAQQLRTEYGMQQVLGGVARSVVAPAAAAAASLDALLQRRELQIERFDAAAFRERVQPSDEELQAFHKANEARFRAAEQARIEYAELNLEALGRDVELPEAELRRYYDENASRWTTAEERRASHILIQADAAASAAERSAAREKAEALLAKLRREPAQFEALARAESQDPGSAAKGGDLGFFGRGAMVKPFEDAVYAMRPGEISPVVETDFGYHVIRLDALRGGQRTPFESVRAEVESQVRQQLAQRAFADAAEQFTNIVYEQPDSLQPVLERFKLQPRSATVKRQPAPDAQGALASQALLDAVFGEDALRLKRNTNAVEVGPNTLVSARVVEHRPERTRPLDEVRDEVRAAVVAERSAALAREAGAKRLAELRADPSATLPTTLTVSRVQLQGQPRELVDAALRADPAALPASLGVDLGAQG